MRHVGDLIAVQHEMGADIALITASNCGGAAAKALLNSLEQRCRLGIHRIPMDRLPSPRDAISYAALLARCRDLRPDILHGHGAKGGAFAALIGRSLGSAAFYTPHGGSLHYEWLSPIGLLSLGSEALLRPLFTGIFFVCDWERQMYDRKIGLGRARVRVVRNGLREDDFRPVKARADAADLLFIGELRRLKGVDVLLRAIAIMNRVRRATAWIVGDGPDRAKLERLCRELGLSASHLRERSRRGSSSTAAASWLCRRAARPCPM
jgi:glycosyltransferase involved in cell wall biosynthesis